VPVPSVRRRLRLRPRPQRHRRPHQRVVAPPTERL
jgi:hypothetical protein